MTDLDRLLQRVRENEEIEKKFFQVETRILTVLKFRDLFEVLLTEIESVFSLPSVWMTLIEDCETVRLMQLPGDLDTLENRLRPIRRERFTDLTGHSLQPLLVNRDLERFEDLFPAGGRGALLSLAVVPISLDGAIIGSLNFGDPSADRFAPDKDTSLLQQLGIKLSLCLSNVTAHEKLSFLAYHDPLTGLLNRRVMQSALNREFARAARYGQPLSLIFIDLDDFKAVNDTHGHECGDAMLQHVADILCKSSRGPDIVARYAGDEFVVILPESEAAAAEQLMKRVGASAEKRPLKRPGAEINVCLSFGIATMGEEEPETTETLLKRADRRLYRLKEARKKRGGACAGRVVAFPASREEKKEP